MTYLDIIPEHADSRETIFKVLMSLEEKYQCIRGQSEHLVVVGDAKIYTQVDAANAWRLAYSEEFQATHSEDLL